MLTFNETGGLSMVIGKINGRKKAISTLANKIVEELTDESIPVYIVDADCKEDGDKLRDLVLEKRPNAKIVRQIVGPVIGAHAAPGRSASSLRRQSAPSPSKRTERHKKCARG